MPQACKFKFEIVFQCGKTGHIANSEGCKGKSNVVSVTEELPNDQDDHFTVYVLYSGCTE